MENLHFLTLMIKIDPNRYFKNWTVFIILTCCFNFVINFRSCNWYSFMMATIIQKGIILYQNHNISVFSILFQELNFPSTFHTKICLLSFFWIHFHKQDSAFESVSLRIIYNTAIYWYSQILRDDCIVHLWLDNG